MFEIQFVLLILIIASLIYLIVTANNTCMQYEYFDQNPKQVRNKPLLDGLDIVEDDTISNEPYRGSIDEPVNQNIEGYSTNMDDRLINYTLKQQSKSYRSPARLAKTLYAPWTSDDMEKNESSEWWNR